MGNKFEVQVWVPKWDSDDYEYRHYWCGQSLFFALCKLWAAKREGYGCVTLHWR